MSGRKRRAVIAAGTSLRWRIVLVLLAASLLPLGLLGGGSWVVFGRLLEDKTLELMASIVEGHARSIEAHLSERLHLLELISQTHSLDDLVDPGELAAIFEGLERTSDAGFVDLGIISSDGRHLAYIGPFDLADRNYSSTDWFKEASVQHLYTSDVFAGFRNVPHCILAVRVGIGPEMWMIRGTINSDQFDQLVRRGALGTTGDVYIVNRQGLYQTTPRSGRVLEQAPMQDLEAHPGVRDQRLEVDGNTKIRVSTWINDNRWMLVVEQDEAEVRSPVRQAVARGSLVVLLAAVILVITTLTATFHLTRRIDKANAQRESIARDFIRSAKLASIGELATGLAHEINNPLAVISAEQTNIADIIEDFDQETDPIGSILQSTDRCKAQVKRCANITAKMLQFGRKRETVLAPTEIEPRLRDIEALMERQARVRNIEMILDVEDNLRPVRVDAVELEQLLVNLINNSFDALPGGGWVRISARNTGEGVLLAVEDNGVGIAPEHLDRIFEPFFTTKSVGAGTGLGLSVCFGIVQAWGGRIEAESEPGKGTTMHIYLPAETG